MKQRRSSNRPRKGTVLSICATEGGGKTDMSLTLPTPLAMMSVDPNTEAVVRKAITEGRISADAITQHYIDMPAIAFSDQDDVKGEAETSWEALIDALRPFIDADDEDRPRSVVFDTATEVDRLNVLAEYGKTDQISPEARRNRMGPVNSRYIGMIRSLQNAGIHVALLHRVSEQWASVETRGRSEERRERVEGVFAWDRKGFKETGNICSVEVVLAHDSGRSEKLAGQFGMQIRRSTLRPALKGVEFWGRHKLEDGTRIRKASWAFLMAQVMNEPVEKWL